MNSINSSKPVQNTETLYNNYWAIEHGEPVTDKYLHVDGDVS